MINLFASYATRRILHVSHPFCSRPHVTISWSPTSEPISRLPLRPRVSLSLRGTGNRPTGRLTKIVYMRAVVSQARSTCRVASGFARLQLQVGIGRAVCYHEAYFSLGTISFTHPLRFSHGILYELFLSLSLFLSLFLLRLSQHIFAPQTFTFNTPEFRRRLGRRLVSLPCKTIPSL